MLKKKKKRVRSKSRDTWLNTFVATVTGNRGCYRHVFDSDGERERERGGWMSLLSEMASKDSNL